MIDREIKVLPDVEALTREAASRVVGAARQSSAKRGSFALALSGGSTPKSLYELLATDPYRSQIQWPRVEVFFGDERTVPPDHPESNYRMAYEALLSKVPMPEQNVHRMRGEIDPTQAAIGYGRMLKSRFGEESGVDLALLGMGDDGHTASLFPHTEALKETHHRCVANFVPKLNTWRITLSAPFLNRSGQILILVAGAAKAAVLKQVLHGAANPELYPIQLIKPIRGTVTWLLDESAAAGD